MKFVQISSALEDTLCDVERLIFHRLILMKPSDLALFR